MVLRLLFSAVLIGVFAARAGAVAKVWTGGAMSDSWLDAQNWSPSGSPTIQDDLSVGAITPGAATRLVGSASANSLLISAGASVSTAGNQLFVSGDVVVGTPGASGPASQLIVPSMPGGNGAALIAEDVTIEPTGDFLLEGGFVSLVDPDDFAYFETAGLRSEGYGIINFTDNLPAPTVQFFNSSRFKVGRAAGSVAADRYTLRFDSLFPDRSTVSIAGAPGSVFSFEPQTTLDVRSQLDRVLGRIELAPGSIFLLPGPAGPTGQTIELASGAVIEVDAASTAAGVASVATLRGGAGLRLTGQSEVNVNMGKLLIENGLTAGTDSTINMGQDTTLHLANVSVAGKSTIDGDINFFGPGAALVVDHDVDLNDPVFDWDGFAEDTTTTVNNGATLTVNAQDIESGSEVFDGNLEVFGGALNTNIDGGWTLAGNLLLASGVLANSSSPVDRLSITGAIVSGGSVSRLDGRFRLESSSTVKVTDPSDRLELDGVSEIEAGADFTGDGQIRVNNGASSTLEDGVVIDMELANAGALHLNSVIGEAELKAYEQSTTGELFVQLAGSGEGEYDRLGVSEVASLDGLLNVSLVDGFEPRDGDQFLLLAADTLTGRFANVSASLPDLEEGLVWELVYDSSSVVLRVSEGLAGDFNGDGLVDAADYTVWRDGLNQPGGFTQADYQLWLDDFGRSTRSTTTAVPEPGAALLLALAVACRRRR